MREAFEKYRRAYGLWFLGGGVWLALAAVLTLVLYIRGRFLLDGLTVSDVAVWQVLVWLPWLFFPVFIKRSLKARGVQDTQDTQDTQEDSGAASPRPGLKTLVPFLALMVFHVFWMIYASHYTSPFDAEGAALDQRWGIFRFHLIFWALIDAMAMGTLATAFILGGKRHPAAGAGNAASPLRKTVTIKDRNRTEVIPLEEVVCVMSEDYYARIHSRRGDFLIRTPLRTLAGEWPGGHFLQTHRSCLINLHFLKTLDRKQNQAVLSDGTRCPVSRSGLRRLRAFLEEKS